MKTLRLDDEPTTVSASESISVLRPTEFAETASNIVVLNTKEMEIPGAFLEALDDLKNERFVDVEKAHTEKPPFRLED